MPVIRSENCQLLLGRSDVVSRLETGNYGREAETLENAYWRIMKRRSAAHHAKPISLARIAQ
jgi:hypothetical protein